MGSIAARTSDISRARPTRDRSSRRVRLLSKLSILPVRWPFDANAAGYFRELAPRRARTAPGVSANSAFLVRSEEHTSELQSRGHLVCRLLLEKKKKSNQ